MSTLLRRIFRYLLYAAAAGVMLLALLVGIARLLLPLVPDYQEDIRALAVQATGFDVQFQHISASWPISGPEIQFLEVTIESQEDRKPVFIADRLDIGISLTQLIRDRKIAVSRVRVNSTRIDVRRDADGTLRFQGRLLDDLLPARNPDAQRLPDIVLELVDIEVAYRDLARGPEPLVFAVERLDVEISDEELIVVGDIGLPAEFGDRATLSVGVPVAILRNDVDDDSDWAEEWRLSVSGEGLDAASILRYALRMPTPIASMRGDVAAGIEFVGRMPRSVTVDLNFADVALSRSPDDVERYRDIVGRIEWDGNDDGWLLAGTELRLDRDSFFSPETDFSVSWRPGNLPGSGDWSATADFVRLHDWYPIVRAFASAQLSESLLPADVRGDVSDLRLEVRVNPGVAPEYAVEVRFEDLGVEGLPGGEGLSGITGVIAADEAGGRLELDSEDAAIILSRVFAAPLEVESIQGLLLWRVTADGLRILSDNVRVRTSFAEASSRFELEFPSNGDSPYLDLTAFAQSWDVTGVIGFLPLRRFPDTVSAWLRKAIVAGRVTGADVAVRGPMRLFPFDHGEGVFRVAVDVVDGVLDYKPGWPRVEDLSGQLVFDGVGLYTRSNRASYGGIPVVDVNVEIKDLRRGMLEVTGPQTASIGQVLGFLQASPIAAAVGPTLQRVEGEGELSADVRLRLPIKKPRDYDLRIDATTRDARLNLQRLDFGLSRVAGSVRVRNTKFYADDLTAELLGEPVSIRMRPVRSEGPYSQFVTLAGRTPVENWMNALKLPQVDKFDGAASWQSLIMIPRRNAAGESAPLRIRVRSDLTGVESRMPDPFTKVATTSRPLELEVSFPEDNELGITGRLGGSITWALQLEAIANRWRVERGAVHSGAAAALIPLEPGIELSGYLGFVRIDDWLKLAEEGGQTEQDWREMYRAATLRLDRVALFGQVFSGVSVKARREGANWLIDLDGPDALGSIVLPMAPDNDNPAILDLERLWLVDSEEGDGGQGDPREIIPARIDIDNFVLGKLRPGALRAEVRSTPSGIVIDPLETATASFSMQGDAAWLVHPNDENLQQSRLVLSLEGSDIASVLTGFGYDPVIEGEAIAATADLTWDGGPDRDFLYRADGRFSVELKTGTVTSLEPGGGRFLGILSVTALPRRLALDFRDVTDDGLGFESLRGDFTVDGGSVYTCNLGLEGHVADMGIVGRAGLLAEDYDQLAVVRPHVSNLFALPATVVGGPAAGAAILLFSQIFRKPLSQLGESYYSVTGSWEDPQVKQLAGSEVDVTPLKNCEAYVEAALAKSLSE